MYEIEWPWNISLEIYFSHEHFVFIDSTIENILKVPVKKHSHEKQHFNVCQPFVQRKWRRNSRWYLCLTLPPSAEWAESMTEWSYWVSSPATGQIITFAGSCEDEMHAWCLVRVQLWQRIKNYIVFSKLETTTRVQKWCQHSWMPVNWHKGKRNRLRFRDWTMSLRNFGIWACWVVL